ncbi:hypothetical protein [Actinoplanes sp. NPDC020271]|uniref:hypothetical protein n=1 Tax=Actinoplanes sp. NPDC020271 TaxID=3363896 RepID=UPI0037BAC0ED
MPYRVPHRGGARVPRKPAAVLTAALDPAVALPHHYAFHSGQLGDRIITKGDQDPRHCTDAPARLAPHVATRIVLPGTPVTIP